MSCSFYDFSLGNRNEEKYVWVVYFGRDRKQTRRRRERNLKEEKILELGDALLPSCVFRKVAHGLSNHQRTSTVRQNRLPRDSGKCGDSTVVQAEAWLLSCKSGRPP